MRRPSGGLAVVGGAGLHPRCIHDDEDRFVGIADLIVQTKVTAPLAETY